MITETIKTEIWEDIPDKPGHIRYVSQVPLSQVYNQIKDLLKEKGLYESLDYFHASYTDRKKEDDLFPWSRWVAAYTVIGDNEGHYIHIDAIGICEPQTNKPIRDRQNLFTGKTFGGFDEAAKISVYISSLFNK